MDTRRMTQWTDLNTIPVETGSIPVRSDINGEALPAIRIDNPTKLSEQDFLTYLSNSFDKDTVEERNRIMGELQSYNLDNDIKPDNSSNIFTPGQQEWLGHLFKIPRSQLEASEVEPSSDITESDPSLPPEIPDAKSTELAAIDDEI